jgi:hypothetical protein
MSLTELAAHCGDASIGPRTNTCTGSCPWPREHDPEATTATYLTLHFDLRAMSQADGIGDGKPKTRPAIFTRTRLINAEEALEDVR